MKKNNSMIPLVIMSRRIGLVKARNGSSGGRMDRTKGRARNKIHPAITQAIFFFFLMRIKVTVFFLVLPLEMACLPHLSSPKVFIKPILSHSILLHPVLNLSMINVYDLHFKKDVLPLFDHVHNEFSRAALLELLSEMPASVDEIYVRQDIIKAFLGNEQLYAPFSYSRIEFNQVYGYIEDKKVRRNHLFGNVLRLHLLFARSESNREKGGLYQFVYFLYKVQQFYFAGLMTEAFPAVFRNQVESIKRMLSSLEVEKYFNIGRGRGFSILEVARICG